MARPGVEILDPISHGRVVFHETAATTDGRLLRLESWVPASRGVPLHIHVAQEERFEIVSGTLEVRVGRRRVTCAAGDRIAVPPGTAHRFHNASSREARVVGELRPALSTERLFEQLAALDEAGRIITPLGLPGPLALAVLARQHGDAFFYLPWLPVGLQRAVLAPFSVIARRSGYRLPATPS